MKPLTRKDLPALASLIRWTTHRKVEICKNFLFIRRGDKIITDVVIRNGQALASDIIPGFIMKSCHGFITQWIWEIVI
jgi:hypothetical protein